MLSHFLCGTHTVVKVSSQLFCSFRASLLTITLLQPQFLSAALYLEWVQMSTHAFLTEPHGCYFVLSPIKFGLSSYSWVVYCSRIQHRWWCTVGVQIWIK